MKYFGLYMIRAYLGLGLFLYFKKIKTVTTYAIPKAKPVLFLSNHQNALLDALLIATRSGRLSYFLTRAGVFNKPWVAKLLGRLRMLPIYRIRDGWSKLSQNNPIFESCSKLLSRNEALVIFPEGSHNLKRTVRPLSKGFTRIVLDTLEKYPETDLQLIPVGMNFVKAASFGDSAALYFGAPIPAISYRETDKNQSIVKLKKDLHNRICGLTTHIQSDDYEETLQELIKLNVDFLNPKEVNQCIESSFKNCQSRKRNNPGLTHIFKVLLILNLIVPYAFWKLYIEPKIGEIEFRSTFRFAVAITLVPIYLMLLGLILWALVNIQFALIYVAAVIIISQLAIKL